ncbi:DUF1972 domain-containing protein [Rhodobacter ferrooxidans]|uniref:DUF1972 domain-containing protein n=1 Tax=Rhodobacter ferrooxidans TaxID=371731 RepID=C8S381_9RHOB|nr:DUF1972 domain-containing protein [Rhodobacter sp. SW2]EEW24563.1 Protein of unknown function DUF1972 [Rhodobacter sp. SW2]
MTRIAILGTVGVPASYGGFETLAENLVRYGGQHAPSDDLLVYCSARAYPDRPPRFLSARLRYIPLQANGAQSIPYDVWSLFDAVARRADVIVLLGVSGALALPFVRLVSRARIVTNIDGIEWQRAKWQGLARLVLRLSERAAVRWSHAVIADNQGIADHVRQTYQADCQVIAYGGDHALATVADGFSDGDPGGRYALALCRIEPENNVAMILEAFAAMPDQPLVFVGNWNNSAYGRALRDHFARCANIRLCDPVYRPGKLRALRDRAWLYVHGHSAGGTNPSLVEMMHFAIPVLAHGCNFNRFTTEDAAQYFLTANELATAVRALDAETAAVIGQRMSRIARARYTWEKVGEAYFRLIHGLL